MSIAHRPYTVPLRTTRATTPRLYPVFIVPADHAQDVTITITAKVGAPIGEVDVHMNGAVNLDQVEDWSQYTETLRTFARHLACYADAFEDAAILDF